MCKNNQTTEKKDRKIPRAVEGAVIIALVVCDVLKLFFDMLDLAHFICPTLYPDPHSSKKTTETELFADD